MSNWVTEGEKFEGVSEKNIFINKSIRNFLTSHRIFWVISAKGMGKTLLLRFKREILEKSEAGLLIIPRDDQLDYVRLPDSLPRLSCNQMRDKSFWKDVWEVSLALSTVSYFNFEAFSPETLIEVRDAVLGISLPVELKKHFEKKFASQRCRKLNPSEVLVQILSSGTRAIQKIRRNQLQTIDNLYSPQHLKSGVAIFIDSFDQALMEKYHYDLDIWISGQIGLLKACWEINRQNPHIKIYTSIRQEAFAAFKDENRLAMHASILLIHYHEKELGKIMDVAVRHFEHAEALSSLLGFSKIDNPYVRKEEDLFKYIYRHTIGRPRGLMAVGNALSNDIDRNDEKSQRKASLRSLVNGSMAREISKTYLENEMCHFLAALHREEDRARFFKLIRSNILTQENIDRIWKKFNEKDKIAVCPFCELFNIGLLGVIEYDVANDLRVQRFRKPFEFDWNMKDILKISTYYLLHPSLQDLIKAYNPNYYLHRILIGDGYPWNPDDESLIKTNMIKIFFSYSHNNSDMVEHFIDKLEDSLFQRGVLLDAWLDKWKIRGGEWIQEKVEEGLHESDLLLLICSEESVKSDWVKREWQMKFQEEIANSTIKIIPILLDLAESQLPSFLQGKKGIRLNTDNTTEYRQNLKKICEDIIAIVPKVTDLVPTILRS